MPTHLGRKLRIIAASGGKVHLSLAGNNASTELETDHVVGGTGYRVSLERLRFLDDGLLKNFKPQMTRPC
jgi:hypothetical protein